RRSKPLTAELAGDIHADAAAAEDRRRRGVFGGDRCVVAPGAEVQHVRRVVFVEANRPVVVDGVVKLGIAFEEAGIALGDVAVHRQAAVENTIQLRTRDARTRERRGIEAGSTGIEIAEQTEVESGRAESRADTAVD